MTVQIGSKRRWRDRPRFWRRPRTLTMPGAQPGDLLVTYVSTRDGTNVKEPRRDDNEHDGASRPEKADRE